MEAEYEVNSDDDQKAFEGDNDDDIKISEIFIISRLGYFYSTFAIVDSFASMFSSYFYSWLSVYGSHFHKETIEIYIIFIEAYFLIAMTIKFLTDYTEDGEKFPCRDPLKIAKRYLNNGFVVDFISIFPL